MSIGEPKFSLVIHHSPWREDRVVCLREMLLELTPLAQGVAFLLNDTDHRARDWQDAKVDWALDGWRWSAFAHRKAHEAGAPRHASHHVFLTDDLRIMPGFWPALRAMVAAAPSSPIGLLCNSPKAVRLFSEGRHWYASNSWITGPAYVLPHELLVAFLAWFESLPDGRERGHKGYENDDSNLNEWISTRGPARTLHPLPTIVEHRGDLPSTVGHGDSTSRERVSWRASRRILTKGDGDFVWESYQATMVDPEALAEPEWWKGADDAPFVPVSREEEATSP